MLLGQEFVQFASHPILSSSSPKLDKL